MGRQLRSLVESILVQMLAFGHSPNHIALIMDGNRRYATKQGLVKTAGHTFGFDAFMNTLKWCFALNIRTLTVYAFSVENFKRSREEVDFLMEMALEKCNELIEHSTLIHKHKVCIRIIGELDLLPAHLQKAACKLMLSTRHHKDFHLNICFPYTSQQEILHASNTLVAAVEAGKLQSSDINPFHISKLLYTWPTMPLDILIRTSGEHRLSEFLTWQITESRPLIVWTNTLWPDFTIWTFCPIWINYQIKYVWDCFWDRINAFRTSSGISCSSSSTNNNNDSSSHQSFSILERSKNAIISNGDSSNPAWNTFHQQHMDQKWKQIEIIANQ